MLNRNGVTGKRPLARLAKKLFCPSKHRLERQDLFAHSLYVNDKLAKATPCLSRLATDCVLFIRLSKGLDGEIEYSRHRLRPSVGEWLKKDSFFSSVFPTSIVRAV